MSLDEMISHETGVVVDIMPKIQKGIIRRNINGRKVMFHFRELLDSVVVGDAVIFTLLKFTRLHRAEDIVKDTRVPALVYHMTDYQKNRRKA